MFSGLCLNEFFLFSLVEDICKWIMQFLKPRVSGLYLSHSFFLFLNVLEIILLIFIKQCVKKTGKHYSQHNIISSFISHTPKVCLDDSVVYSKDKYISKLSLEKKLIFIILRIIQVVQGILMLGAKATTAAIRIILLSSQQKHICFIT